MPQKKIVFKPGVNQENTRYANAGGWYDCDKVRFRQGFPEKLGGWSPISTGYYIGAARSLWNWVTLAGANLIGLGTSQLFYIVQGGVYNDITPYRYQTAGKLSIPANSFTTLVNSTTVRVTLPGLGITFRLYTNDVLNIYGVTAAINGIPANNFNQQFTITGYNYSGSPYVTIALATFATSTGTSGSACQIQYFAYWFKQTSIQSFARSRFFTITANISMTVGDRLYLTQPDGSGITVGGVTLIGSYQCTAVIGGSFQIASVNIATYNQTISTPSYGQYEAQVGSDYVIAQQGWNAGYWGNNTWGNSIDPTQTKLGLWTQSNFGENLIFGSRGGQIYEWQPSVQGLTSSGTPLLQAYGADSAIPVIQNNIAISDASRFVLALGCNDYGTTVLNPMLIRWSDQENPIVWTPSASNQAGSIQLSHGSTIVGYIQTRQELVVFTDSSVYSLQYLGPPVVWGSQLVGTNTSILGPNAMALASGVVYWMGNGKFYTYNGTVQTLACDLREFIFSDINTQQNYQVYAGTNEAFNEVWWFYCSKAATQNPDTYVIYNYVDNAWYFGYMSRTAWLDVGLTSYPVAACPTGTTGVFVINQIGNLLYHEYGTDDNNNGTALPMHSYIQTSEFDVNEGDRFSFIWQMLPDVRFNGSAAGITPKVTMTLQGLQNSGSGLNNQLVLGQAGQNSNSIVQTAAPVPANYNYQQVVIEQFTGTVPCRVRGRQLIFRIESNDLGVQWQLGAPRINIKQDGRRGNT